MTLKNIFHSCVTFALALALLPACSKDEKPTQPNTTAETVKSDLTHTYTLFTNSNIPAPQTATPIKLTDTENKVAAKDTDELDFEVQNRTNKTIYVTCFSYIQKEPFQRWRWDKSDVLRLDASQNAIVNIDTIPDPANRSYTYGYLAVFDNEEEANDAVLELVKDDKLIDLDLLYKLKGKKVAVEVLKYGFKQAALDFALIEKGKKKTAPPELDFTVKNLTGKPVYVTCFVYQNKDNIRTTWTYDKTPVLFLEPEQEAVIDVDSIVDPRNQTNVTADLALFELNEEQQAHVATYQVLETGKKLSLGLLTRLKNKKVLLTIEKYGSAGDLIEFGIKPVRRIFAKQEQLARQAAARAKTQTPSTAPTRSKPVEKFPANTIVPPPLPAKATTPEAPVVPIPSLEKTVTAQQEQKIPAAPINVPKRKNSYQLFAQS